MKTLLWATATLGLLIAICAVVPGQPTSSQTKSDLVTEDIAIQYARANLKLARVRLARFENVNHKAPGSIPQMVLERMRANISVAQEQLDHAIRPDDEKPMRAYVRYAEEKARVANLAWKNALELRKRPSAKITELDLEKYRLEAKVAELRLQMWQDRAYLPTLLDQMQWQIDRLSEELLELRKTVETMNKDR